VITCVFDGTDRIQHMFMRFLDDEHPALRGMPQDRRERYRSVIEDTYIRMDRMLARTLTEVDTQDPKQLLLVISDHGFKTFRRGVNLNSWLHQQGYLVLKEGCSASGEWFVDVDWSRSRAFALGLSGIFLNVQGREAEGFVQAGAEADALADEIAAKLTGLVDTGTGERAIHKVHASHLIYDGPYAHKAPDLIVGYEAGWRASWTGVRGIVDDVVFDDNAKAWSGDHCIEPELVPGVLIANQDLGTADRQPSITDLAPTLLQLFGIPAPRHMDGVSLV
jgi:predicted AlkP superfamily phosphohydrolase/phosphomutase